METRNRSRQRIVLLSLLLLTTAASAEGNDPSPAASLWGLEADLVAPFVPQVHIITARVAFTVRGAEGDTPLDLLVGVYARPNVDHDIVRTIDEYHMTLGARQYFLRDWSLEAQLDGGYAWGTANRIDGRDHNGPAVLGELHLGYRYLFLGDSLGGPYFLPQVGVIQGLFTDIGPRGGKPDTFFSGKLQLGYRF